MNTKEFLRLGAANSPSERGKFPARLHVLLARDAKVGLVIRRGPSKSVCTVLWDRKRDKFIARAIAAGVHKMIITGTSLAVSEAAVRIARESPNHLFATAGVHPHDSRNCTDENRLQKKFPLGRSFAPRKGWHKSGFCGS